MKELFEDFTTAFYETVNDFKTLILIFLNPREWEISKKIVHNRIDID